MKSGNITVVRTGSANLASVAIALERTGRPVRFTTDPDTVAGCECLVLPGVGALGAAMQRLEAHGITNALADRVRRGRPLLAICLGLQMLCRGSEETPHQPGLGILPGTLRRFPDAVRVPQLGWNRVEVEPAAGCRWLRTGWAYFANSYRLTDIPAGWKAAWARHGGRFVAAFERDDILACQFHPELSGQWGGTLLTRWLASVLPRTGNGTTPGGSHAT